MNGVKVGDLCIHKPSGQLLYIDGDGGTQYDYVNNEPYKAWSAEVLGFVSSKFGTDPNGSKIAVKAGESVWADKSRCFPIPKDSESDALITSKTLETV